MNLHERWRSLASRLLADHRERPPKRGGQPRKYASNAERQRAYRERMKRKDVMIHARWRLLMSWLTPSFDERSGEMPLMKSKRRPARLVAPPGECACCDRRRAYTRNAMRKKRKGTPDEVSPGDD